MANLARHTETTDVRMRGFMRRDTVEAALVWLDAQLQPLAAESVPLAAASGRVLAAPVVAGVNVPQFARAMMDGYAVQARDTEGAAPYNRLPLTVVGQAMPGRACDTPVQRGQAVRIMTGAPMPCGADAVLPAELTESANSQLVAIGEVTPGKHVGLIGEDVAAGATLLNMSRRLRPQDLGVLSSIGCAQVNVVRQPTVRLVITGSELLPAGSAPRDYCIADANGPMLSALVARDGGVVDFPGLVPDDPIAITAALMAPADVIIVSGGSSVGAEDFVPTLLAEHGELAIHGIAMRPSSPTGMGRIGDRLVFLLPGNPVSCLCAYDFFAGRAIRKLGGLPAEWQYRPITAKLARKLTSVIGRLDYARVQLIDGQVEPVAIGGASILTSTTRADGFVIVPADSEGYPTGDEVTVWLYDG
jgi:molybdopterin molybdotransferase